MICHAHRWLWAHRLDQSCSAMQRYSSETKHDCCNFVHIACLTYHICSYSSLFSASFNKVMIPTFKQQVWRKPVKHLDFKARTKLLKHGHSSIKTWTHSFDYAYLRKKITLIWTSTFRALKLQISTLLTLVQQQSDRKCLSLWMEDYFLPVQLYCKSTAGKILSVSSGYPSGSSFFTSYHHLERRGFV